MLSRGRSSIRRQLDRLTRQADRFEKNLVWMLGSPRSGSTWLLRLLEEHPAVVGVNEPLIGWHLGPFMSDLPGADASKLVFSNATLGRAQAGDSAWFFSDEFRDAWVPALGRLLRERFFEHVRHYPAGVPRDQARLVIKEPNGSQTSDMIMAALPRARLLFLLRDGRDVVDSDLASNLRGSWVTQAFAGFDGIEAASERLSFVTQSAHKWLWRTEATERAYAAHRGPKHMVRYEDLRADPHRHLRAIIDWLELEVTDEALERMIDKRSFENVPKEARGPKAKVRAAQPGSWRENLSDAEQVAVQAVIGPKLRELGYDDS